MTEVKRLMRSKDKKVAGVCAGLANYFDIDPTVVRILFVIIFFAGGASLLAYLIMWIAMPVEP
ncbi:MAG TPA: PspC domain-containing protein [Prolixibacteraceae bacterium]|jgi:phage shock protein C|nr:PspC domain-containing protein [Prolixibacteraceae bacterium]